MKPIRLAIAGIAAAVMTLSLCPARAQQAAGDWPTKSITLIVPYAAGGIAIKDKRILGLISYYAAYVFENNGDLSTNLGSVILEGSKAGATTAANAACRAAADVAGACNEEERGDRAAAAPLVCPVKPAVMHPH